MSEKEQLNDAEDNLQDEAGQSESAESSDNAPTEIGGRKGPEPTRFGDWEKNGRCIDF